MQMNEKNYWIHVMKNCKVSSVGFNLKVEMDTIGNWHKIITFSTQRTTNMYAFENIDRRALRAQVNVHNIWYYLGPLIRFRTSAAN